MDEPSSQPRRTQLWLANAAELALMLQWALAVAAPYANSNPRTAPRGIEYDILIQSNYVWTRLAECGACALWNGSVRGGAPAFVDPHANLLRPLVYIPTLLFGVFAGSKITLVGALFSYGAAQWWLARALGLGRAARLWSAGMAVAAGSWPRRWTKGWPAWRSRPAPARWRCCKPTCSARLDRHRPSDRRGRSDRACAAYS